MPLKTKCLCGARFEYDAEEAGQTVTCDCGKPVLLVPPPPAPPAPTALAPFTPLWCGKCNAIIKSEPDRRLWGPNSLVVCKKCFHRLQRDEDDRLAKEFAARQPAETTRGNAPSYLALAIVSAILRASGIALLLLCVLTICFAFSQSPPSYPIIAAGVSSAVSGLLLLAAAEALACLRDIAINSFNKVAPRA